jgi:hypothetical protein
MSENALSEVKSAKNSLAYWQERLKIAKEKGNPEAIETYRRIVLSYETLLTALKRKNGLL